MAGSNINNVSQAGTKNMVLISSPLNGSKGDNCFRNFGVRLGICNPRMIVEIRSERADGSMTTGKVRASAKHAAKIEIGAKNLNNGFSTTKAARAFMDAKIVVAQNNLSKARSEARSEEMKAFAKAIDESKIAKYVNESKATELSKGLFTKIDNAETSVRSALGSISWKGIGEGIENRWTSAKKLPGEAVKWVNAKIEENPNTSRNVGYAAMAVGSLVALPLGAIGVGGYLLAKTAAGATVGGEHGIGKGIKNVERLIHKILKEIGFQDSQYNRSKETARSTGGGRPAPTTKPPTEAEKLAALIQEGTWKPTHEDLAGMIQRNNWASTDEEQAAVLQQLMALFRMNVSEEAHETIARVASRQGSVAEASGEATAASTSGVLTELPTPSQHPKQAPPPPPASDKPKGPFAPLSRND